MSQSDSTTEYAALRADIAELKALIVTALGKRVKDVQELPIKTAKRDPNLITIPEAARAYRINAATIRSLCRLGKIKHVIRPGRGPTGQVTWLDIRSAASVLGVGV